MNTHTTNTKMAGKSRDHPLLESIASYIAEEFKVSYSMLSDIELVIYRVSLEPVFKYQVCIFISTLQDTRRSGDIRLRNKIKHTVNKIEYESLSFDVRVYISRFYGPEDFPADIAYIYYYDKMEDKFAVRYFADETCEEGQVSFF